MSSLLSGQISDAKRVKYYILLPSREATPLVRPNATEKVKYYMY
jgi:hypothetical protein